MGEHSAVAMEWLCGSVGNATTATALVGLAGSWPPWLASPCHGHVVNALSALTATYLALLLLMCLRCSDGAPGAAGLTALGVAGPGVAAGLRGHWTRTARPPLSLALLASLAGELAEAMLARTVPAAVAATCSAALWLPAELLDGHLGAGTLRLLPIACGTLMAAAR